MKEHCIDYASIARAYLKDDQFRSNVKTICESGGGLLTIVKHYDGTYYHSKLHEELDNAVTTVSQVTNLFGGLPLAAFIFAAYWERYI
jgi:hypothetical protein